MPVFLQMNVMISQKIRIVTVRRWASSAVIVEPSVWLTAEEAHIARVRYPRKSNVRLEL